MNTKGKNGDLLFTSNLNLGIEIFPNVDLISTESVLVFVEVTVTLLLIDANIAFVPYTTKCSPNRITLPGADATDFK